MSRSDIVPFLRRIDELANEINVHVPIGPVATIGFRADLAGLLAVSIVATYESCVKETLINCAGRHHHAFADYCSRNYEKLNSKVGVNDLYRYAELFDPKVNVDFGIRMKKLKAKFETRAGINVVQRYEQLLKWRHAFAHAGTRIATVEDVVGAHRYAQRVIREFNYSFDQK